MAKRKPRKRASVKKAPKAKVEILGPEAEEPRPLPAARDVREVRVDLDAAAVEQHIQRHATEAAFAGLRDEMAPAVARPVEAVWTEPDEPLDHLIGDINSSRAPLQIHHMELDALLHDPANARLHSDANLDAIKESLRRFGQQKPIVVRRSGETATVDEFGHQADLYTVIAGNGTLAAAAALDWTFIAAVVTELDGAEATAYAIADNRAGELAEWDHSALLRALEGDTGNDGELGSGEPVGAGLGFAVGDLEILRATVSEMEAGPAPGEVGGTGGGPSSLPPSIPAAQDGAASAGDSESATAGAPPWAPPPFHVSQPGDRWTCGRVTLECAGIGPEDVKLVAEKADAAIKKATPFLILGAPGMLDGVVKELLGGGEVVRLKGPGGPDVLGLTFDEVAKERGVE